MTDTFDCQLCDKSFSLKKNLIQHMAVHSDALPVLCKICGERFKWRSGLKSHMEDVHGHGDNKDDLDEKDDDKKKSSSTPRKSLSPEH